MSKIKAIIFDFDGVIVESVRIKLYAFAELYSEYGEVVQEKVKSHHLYNGGMSRFEKIKYYHNEYLGMKIMESEISELAKKFSDLVVKKVIEAPYVRGAYEFLEKYNSYYDFFICSGTPQDEIRLICRERKIDKFFLEILGSPKIKSDLVKNIKYEHKYRTDEMVLVGDAISDLIAANQNRINFVGRYTSDERIKEVKNKICDLSQLERFL